MSMLQDIFNSARRGDFAQEDKGLCGCRGSGWFLSGVDTWHECPVHFLGQPCPEDEGGLGTPEWRKFSIEVRRFEVDRGPAKIEQFHVVARQKATGIKVVHLCGFEDKRRAERLMARVAKSGRAFSELDIDIWAGPKEWSWPDDKSKP